MLQQADQKLEETSSKHNEKPGDKINPHTPEAGVHKKALIPTLSQAADIVAHARQENEELNEKKTTETQSQTAPRLKADRDGVIRQSLEEVLGAVFANHEIIIIADGGHFSIPIQETITLATERFSNQFKAAETTKATAAISLELPQHYQDQINEALAGSKSDVNNLAFNITRKILGGSFKFGLTADRLQNAKGKVGVIAHDVSRSDADGKPVGDSVVNKQWVENITRISKENDYQRLLIVGGLLHTANPRIFKDMPDAPDVDEQIESITGKKPFHIHLISSNELSPVITTGNSDLYKRLTSNFNIDHDIHDAPDLLISFGEISDLERFNKFNISSMPVEERVEQSNMIKSISEKLGVVYDALDLLTLNEDLPASDQFKLIQKGSKEASNAIKNRDINLAISKCTEIQKLYTNALELFEKESGAIPNLKEDTIQNLKADYIKNLETLNAALNEAKKIGQ